MTVVAQFAVDNREQIVEALDGSTRLMKTILEKQRNLTEILRVMPLALQNLQRARIGDRIPVDRRPRWSSPRWAGSSTRSATSCRRRSVQLIGTDPLGGN